MGGASNEKMEETKGQTKASSDGVVSVSEFEKDKGVYVGVEDDEEEMKEGVPESDFSPGGLGNIWNEMPFTLENCKVLFI